MPGLSGCLMPRVLTSPFAQSRRAETEGLLVLTPSPATDAAALGELLRKRENIGPTLVILPKWTALRPPQILPREVREDSSRDG